MHRAKKHVLDQSWRFAHNGKPGLNIVLTPGIAVSGRLVLLEPREDGDISQDAAAV
jgi:hypothetical protein